MYLDLDGEEEELENLADNDHEDDYHHRRQDSLLKRDDLMANDSLSTKIEGDAKTRDKRDAKKKMRRSKFKRDLILRRQKIFSDKGSINEHLKPVAEKIFCGGSLPQSQLVHYSRENVLIMEFHSMDFYQYLNLVHKSDAQHYRDANNNQTDDKMINDLSFGNSSKNVISGGNNSDNNNNSDKIISKFGFSGAYKFLSKNTFKSDGDPLSGTDCDLEFLSILTSNSDNYEDEDDDSDSYNSYDKKLKLRSPPKGPRMEGKFFSPNFPSTFDPNLKCAYHFMGKFNERVQITFDKIDLSPDYDSR